MIHAWLGVLAVSFHGNWLERNENPDPINPIIIFSFSQKKYKSSNCLVGSLTRMGSNYILYVGNPTGRTWWGRCYCLAFVSYLGDLYARISDRGLDGLAGDGKNWIKWAGEIIHLVIRTPIVFFCIWWTIAGYGADWMVLTRLAY